MTSLGAASIQLTLDRSQFDRDLAKLQQEDVPSFAPQLKLDTKDFNRQVLGLQGFIPTLSIPVSLDTTSIKKQLQSIKLDCIPVSTCLHADGLKRQLKALSDGSQDLYEVDLSADVAGFSQKLKSELGKQSYSLSVGLDTLDFEKILTESFEKALDKTLKKAKGKNLFDGIGKAIALPFNFIGNALQETLNGVFLGISLPLGEKLGHGIANGLEANFSGVIGSFELLGEKLVTQTAPKLGNTVGGRIATSILNSEPLVKLRTDLAQQINEFIGEADRLIASKAGSQEANNRNKSQTKQAQQNLGEELRQNIQSAPERQERIDKIREKLPAVREEVKARQADLSKAESEQRLRLARISPFEDADQVLEKTNFSIDKASAELSKAILKEKTLEQLIVQFQTESDRIIQKLRTTGADTSAIDNIESTLKLSAAKGQEIIARIDGNIAILQENIREARSRVKRFREEEQRLRQEAIASQDPGEARALFVESKKFGLRANDVNSREIVAYKNSIKENISNKEEAIKGFVQERQGLREKLNQEIANLAESTAFIEEPQVLKKRRTRKRVSSRDINTPVQPTSQDQAIAPPLDVPQLFKDIAAQLASISNIAIAPNQIPTLARGDENAKFKGKYTAATNSITLPPGTFDDLTAGIISPEVVKTIVHELRHAMQTGFGKRKLTESENPEFDLIKGNPEEQKNLSDKISASTQFFKQGAFNATPKDVSVVQKLEEDAYVFAERYFKQVFDSITQQITASTKSFKLPNESDLLEEIKAAQSVITANLRQSFKGSPRDRKIINQPLAEETLTEIDNQIAYVNQQLQRTDLSNEARQKLGRFKGSIEGQYRQYSPALRAAQPGKQSQSTTGGINAQSVNLELFEVDPAIEQELARLRQRITRQQELAKGASPKLEIKKIDQILTKIKSLEKDFDQYSRNILSKIATELESNQIDADIAVSQLERLTRRAENRAKKNLNGIIQNFENSSANADKALSQLGRETSDEVSGILSEINYQEKSNARKARRKARSVQQKYGLEDTFAPQVEAVLPETTSRLNPIQQVFQGFRKNAIEKSKAAAIALNQQAQILLADIQTQLTLGDNAQKESELLQRQIAENEKALDKILNTIRRASAGKEPSLTPGDLQRLSGQAETLDTQIDQDRERVAGNKRAIANSKELRPVTERLVSAASNSQSILSKEVISDKDLTDLRKYNQEIKELFGLLGEPPIPPSNIFEQLTQNVGGLGNAAFTAVKGFLAFQGLISLQNFLSTAAQDAFKAYVEFDKLKTALNFASGGSAGGANNLAFIKKQVDDLAIPLEASIKGFTQLAGAARDTALEGQQTKELFTGISQASTVLSLSADDTAGAIGALEKILSEGKVSSEALRLELGSRIPGAFAIAARSMGVTEEELSRLLETGQVLSQDFLPKFGKQLQSEFGEASKTASDNAQSAIFKLENSWLTLQQTVGEGIAPVAVPGLKLFSKTLDIVGGSIKELMAIAASASIVLAFNLANALKTVVANLVLTRAATGTLGGGFQALGQIVNNSLSLKIGAAIFGVIEIIKLLNDQVNTNLVKSFDEAADAAIRAANASEEAFEKGQNRKPGTQQEKEAPPRATSDTGRFVDDFLINPANFIVQHTFTDIPKFATTGESEKTRVLDSNSLQQQATTSLLSGAKLRESEIKSQKGDVGELPIIDKTLRDESLQRQILEAQAKRDYTDKGLAIPASIQTKLTQESLNINQLNNKRGDIAKPYNDTLAALNQGINSYKSKIEELKDPKTIDNLGAKKIEELTKTYKDNIETLLQQKNSLEATLAAFNVNPILKFNDAYRKLNLTLNETTEKNQIVATQRGIKSAETRLQGFSSNRLATRQSALTDAITARDAASADAQNQQKILDALNTEVRSPALQPQLKRLGITPDSSAAKVQDIINNTKDESDKALLEKIKSVREQEAKTLGAKKTSVEASEKVKQTLQDNTLSELQFGVAGATAAIQRRENLKTAAVRKAQQDRTVTEIEAAEKTARIQLNSTESQQKSVGIQLRLLAEYHRQGIVGAEEFATRQRDLTTEQTNLQKQSAEQQLAVFEAVNRRKLEQIELANKKAEAAIALSQTLATTGVRSGVLSGRLDSIEAPRQQNLIEQQASQQRIGFIKAEIAQTKQLQVDKVISAKESTEKQLDLNQQLAAANQQLIDQQIQAQEQLRAAIEKTFQRRKEQSELEISRANTGIQQGYLEQFSAPEIDEKGLDLARTGATLNNSSVSASRQIGLLQEQLAGVDKLGYAEKDAADKKRALLTEIEKLRQQQIQTEVDLIKNKEEIEINGIERVQKVEENRYKLAVSNIEQQKSALELYTASLDRTTKLEESRYNLTKATADATVSGLDIRKDSANRALELSRRIKTDENLDPKVRNEITKQLNQAGFGTNELDILKKRQQIEDEIASKKLEALKTEQEFQRKSLVLDLKRQQIAAQTAVYEAESSRISAAKSKLEADKALRIAQIKRDPVEIQIAKVGVELADRDISLSDRKLQNAKDNLGIQDELARNAVLTQEATQRSAIDQAIAADNARRQAGALERVEATVNKSVGKSGGKDEAADKAAADVFAQKPGEGIFAYNLRINKAKAFGQILEAKNQTLEAGEGFSLQSATSTVAGDYGGRAARSDLSLSSPNTPAIPTTDKTVSEALNNSKIKVAATSSGYEQFTEALKSANKGIEARLDKLLDSFVQANNAPKSLTVMSPNPVDDAAKIYSDMSRGMVRSSGL